MLERGYTDVGNECVWFGCVGTLGVRIFSVKKCSNPTFGWGQCQAKDVCEVKRGPKPPLVGRNIT